MPKIKNCKHCKQPITKPDLRRSGFCTIKCYYSVKNDKLPPKKPIVESAPLPPLPVMPVPKARSVKPIHIDNPNMSYRDVNYLAFIRTQPCLVCGARQDIHAHHAEVGGMGIKGSDYSAIPLCMNHHTGGNNAVHVMGKSKFLEYFDIDLTSTYLRLRNLYENSCKKKK